MPYGSRIRLLSNNPAADEATPAELLSAHQIDVLSIVPKPISMEEVFVHTISSLE